MVDKLSKEQRSVLMAGVRTTDTAPELIVRCALHRAGFRYVLHARDLPGRPDIVLPRYRMAVFVHGCFWHGHWCTRGRPPTSNVQFWTAKIDRNTRRDRAAGRALRRLGFQVRTLWACSLEAAVPRLLRELQRARRQRIATRRSDELTKYH
jgi:DNA mismatch endonuclease (patch repair protein)